MMLLSSTPPLLLQSMAPSPPLARLLSNVDRTTLRTATPLPLALTAPTDAVSLPLF